MEKALNAELAKYKEYESDVGYVDFYEFHQCPECDNTLDGVGLFATGIPIVHEGITPWTYQPAEGEVLKNIWMECDGCGWNQYS